MVIARIDVNQTTGCCTYRIRIPAGIVGAEVCVSFSDPVWDSLQKTVVFRGAETRIAQFDGNIAVVPAETVSKPGETLIFGIWGYDSVTGLQLPLIEVPIGIVEESTDPQHDPGTDPSLPAWAQIQALIGNLENLTTQAKENLVAAINETAELLETVRGQSAFDPVSYDLPMLFLTGDITGISKDNAVSMHYIYGELSGNCTLKWQGNSSLAYPKKNYTIQFDQPLEAAEGWGAQTKYCLKADFIDFSHARNVVSAKLWGKLVKSRTGSTIEQIKALPNGGAVDGFPCMVTINGVYNGIYNFNIPKDGWMLGMGSGTTEAMVCAENFAFDRTALLDGTDLELEYVTKGEDPSWVAESLNRLVTAVQNSDGTDLDTTIAQYLDIDSAIDYLIFTVMQCGTDNTAKNYILATYDGMKWFFCAYDMDGTWGLHWSGEMFYSAALNSTLSAGSLKGYANRNKLMNLLYTHKFDAIRQRYNKLRRSVLSEADVEALFVNYTSAVPKALFDAEVRLWPTIPSTMTNNVFQILNWYRNRCKVMDQDIGIEEVAGVTYLPEIAGFVRRNGTISASTNYLRTGYLSLEGITEAEYTTFVVNSSSMATWALFDSNQKWLVSSNDEDRTDYYTVNGSGNTVSHGLLHDTISIAELLESYPTAKYIVLSTNRLADYEIVKNQKGEDVGWGSTEQYITLR